MIRRAIAAVLALVLLTAGAGATASTMAIDDGHGLTDRGAIEAYETDGAASTSLTELNASLTVAEQHDDVGLSGLRVDFNKRYLRLQYNESIPRTLRFHIPAEYWYPITSEIESQNGNVVAEMEPTQSGRATAVTVTVDGQADLVWEIPKEASLVFWSRDRSREVVNNTTGYQPPQLGADGEWQYVPADGLSNSSSYPINGTADGLTMQYDADPAVGNESWRMLPECSGNDVPVCYYEKSGVEGKVFVLSKTADPPDIRFKQGTDASATATSAVNELLDIPSKFLSDLEGLFGGGDTEESNS